jgi:hypothetical protein
MSRPMSQAIENRLRSAANRLGVIDLVEQVHPLLQRTFALPEGDVRYADNALTPGAAPFEPSFSELQPNVLRFTLEPLGPEASGSERRDEATRECRRLIGPFFGHEAVRWFDKVSEEWRGSRGGGRLDYGAFFGAGYDRDGLYSSKVFYETSPQQLDALPLSLMRVVSTALQQLPSLYPLFTTVSCHRDEGRQRVTFQHRGSLRLNDLAPLLGELGLGRQLPGIMQIVGLALGGRFELPDKSVLMALGEAADGPEFELYILLGMIADLPPNFLDLLALGLTERPRELQALLRWLQAFTPDSAEWPGRFSVLSVRTTPASPPRVSLYLRPAEFEIPYGIVGGGVPATEGSDSMIPVSAAPAA